MPSPGHRNRTPCQGVRELPAEHVSGEQIHDRHQVEESFLQRDVGDICRPELVRCTDLLEVHQTGKSLGWFAWHGGAGFLVNRALNLGSA